MFKILASFLFFCLLQFQFISAQDTQQTLQQASRAFADQQFELAYQLYASVTQAGTSLSHDQLFEYGAAAYENGSLQQASNMLSQHIANGKAELNAHLYFGLCKHALADYDLATTAFKTYLRYAAANDGYRPAVKAALRSCAFAKRMQRTDSQSFVDNLGQLVNSRADEYFPISSPTYENRLYFASNRSGVQGEKRDKAGRIAEDGQYKLDIFYTERSATAWLPPEPMPGLLNTNSHDYIVAFAEEGQRLYYFKGHHLQAGHLLTDTFNTIEQFGLNPTYVKTPLQSERGDLDVFFFSDSLLLFAARLPEGFGGLDLYYSRLLADGAWEKPTNLGPEINSYYDERAPFLMADGHSLFFSSNLPTRSIGGYDILSSTFSVETLNWSTPRNLNTPINSSNNELSFRIQPKGLQAFFSSNRHGGQGGYDLYTAYFKDPLEAVAAAVPSFVDSKDEAVVQVDSTIKTIYRFPMLFFEDENELTRGNNQRVLNEVAAILKASPTMHLSLQSHANARNPNTLYALYFSLKTAQEVAGYLYNQGVPKQQLSTTGLGTQYPLAIELIKGEPNPQGQRMNNRIDFLFRIPSDHQVQIKIDKPIISSFMQLSDGISFREISQELIFRLEIARSQAVYTEESYVNLPDLMAEQVSVDQPISYLAGLFTTYEEISTWQQELSKRGFSNTRIVAFLDGKRINCSTDISIIEESKELQYYCENNNK